MEQQLDAFFANLPPCSAPTYLDLTEEVWPL